MNQQDEPVRMCPSAQPEMPGAAVFAVIQGTAAEPQAAYLDRLVPLTPELSQSVMPVKPTEVFRIGAACARSDCQHFAEGKCHLVKRLVQIVPAVVSSLPTCVLRAQCRWWHQEGSAACMRCPQVVTEMYGAGEVLAAAAKAR